MTFFESSSRSIFFGDLFGKNEAGLDELHVPVQFSIR